MKTKFFIAAWIAAFITLLACIVFGDRGVKDLYSLKAESKRLAMAAEELDQENQRLYHNIERLRTDLEYIEDIARQELGMVKTGETVFQFLKKEMKAKKNGLPNSNLSRP